jgi:hypothetical protein
MGKIVGGVVVCVKRMRTSNVEKYCVEREHKPEMAKD